MQSVTFYIRSAYLTQIIEREAFYQLESNFLDMLFFSFLPQFRKGQTAKRSELPRTLLTYNTVAQ